MGGGGRAPIPMGAAAVLLPWLHLSTVAGANDDIVVPLPPVPAALRRAAAAENAGDMAAINGTGDARGVRDLGRPPRVAICLVGELRTFSMPIVAGSIRAVQRRWGADMFVHYHERYDPLRLAHPHRNNASSCKTNHTLLQALQPKVLRQIPELPTCKWAAPIQYHGIAHCFAFAVAYAADHGLPPYDYYVRLRPDLLVDENGTLPNVVAGSDRPYVHPRKADLGFLLTNTALLLFLEQGSQRYRSCPSDCCLENWKGLARARLWLQTPAAIIRHPTGYRWEPRKRRDWTQWLVQSMEHKPHLFHCNLRVPMQAKCIIPSQREGRVPSTCLPPSEAAAQAAEAARGANALQRPPRRGRPLARVVGSANKTQMRLRRQRLRPMPGAPGTEWPSAAPGVPR